LVIDEWFKIAERVARLAGWTDEQKLSYFQEKLTKSAANFNDSLTDVQRQTYAVWKPLVLLGLSDDTIKAVKKCELKKLQQDPTEHVRDFQKRIDDMYKLAYGEGPATSNDANVILVRNDTKKEVLLQGLRKEIATLVWNRLDANATYANAVQTAIDSEKVIEVKKLAQSKDINSAVSAITKESEKTAEKIKELEELVKKLSIQPTATTQATRPIDLSDPAVIAAFNTYNNAHTNFSRNSVRFPDSNRSRSVSPFTYNNRPNRPRQTRRLSLLSTSTDQETIKAVGLFVIVVEKEAISVESAGAKPAAAKIVVRKILVFRKTVDGILINFHSNEARWG
jgi:hypothetical protein